MEERKSLILWIKEHKKKLIGAGISIGVLVLVILGIKNREDLQKLWSSLKTMTTQPPANIAVPVEKVKVLVDIPLEPAQQTFSALSATTESIPFEVSRHIRNLHEGYHASPEKIAEAAKNNIVLLDGQTWVESYMKGGAVA